MRKAEVIEEYEDGYASQVRFVLDAGPVRDEYVLAYEYAEDLSRIEWHLVAPSTVQKAQHGSYDLSDNGDGTCTVTYTLAVELSLGMLGQVPAQGRKGDHGYRAEGAQAAGGVAGDRRRSGR